MIAVSQDALGLQGARVSGGGLVGASGNCGGGPTAGGSDTTNVWARYLSGGRFALAFVNVGNATARITCDAACWATALALTPRRVATKHTGAATANFSSTMCWGASDLWITSAATVEKAGAIARSVGGGGGVTLLLLTPLPHSTACAGALPSHRRHLRSPGRSRTDRGRSSVWRRASPARRRSCGRSRTACPHLPSTRRPSAFTQLGITPAGKHAETCAEIQSCSTGPAAMVNAKFGCKALPKTAAACKKDPCLCNGAWALVSNATVAGAGTAIAIQTPMDKSCLSRGPFTSVVASACDGSSRQQWTFVADGAHKGGWRLTLAAAAAAAVEDLVAEGGRLCLDNEAPSS